jgi:lysophospholipase L1-like esterase
MNRFMCNKNMITKEEIAEKLKRNGKYWISFTGASNTSNEWIHPNWREIIEYVLQNEMTDYMKGDWHASEWGIRTFNFGYDGATTRDLIKKVDYIKTVKPDLVIGFLGGNDPLFGISITEHIKNTSQIIESLQTKVVWCSSIPTLDEYRRSKYRPYAESTMKIPINENLQLVDLFNIYQKFPLDKLFTFKSEENVAENIKEGDIDPIHPNQLGNAYIAKVILKEVFGIEFDPELYWQATLAGEKLPRY